MGFIYSKKKRVPRRVLGRGSEKGLSRRHLERALVEYALFKLRRAPSDDSLLLEKTFSVPKRTQRIF